MKLIFAALAALSCQQILNLVSALSGVIGALILFKWSFAFETPPSWVDDKAIKARDERNRSRMVMQRIGLLFICASFALQAISQFVPA
jgi:hypothetical protein